MKRLRCWLLLPLHLAAGIVWSGGPVCAGPWVPRAGAYFLQVSFATQRAHEMFDADGARSRLADAGEYADDALEFYGEVGFGRRFALIAAAPVKWLRLERAVESDLQSSGVGEVLLGARYGFGVQWAVTAVQINLRSAVGSDPAAAPSLGDDQTDVEAHFLAGGSWQAGLPGFVQGDAGLRARAGRAANEWLYAIEAGVSAAPSVLLSGFVRGTHSRGERVLVPGQAIPDGQTSESYTSAGWGVAYRAFGGVDVRAGYSGLVSGRNTLALTGWRFGVSIKRD